MISSSIRSHLNIIWEGVMRGNGITYPGDSWKHGRGDKWPGIRTWVPAYHNQNSNLGDREWLYMPYLPSSIRIQILQVHLICLTQLEVRNQGSLGDLIHSQCLGYRTEKIRECVWKAIRTNQHALCYTLNVLPHNVLKF